MEWKALTVIHSHERRWDSSFCHKLWNSLQVSLQKDLNRHKWDLKNSSLTSSILSYIDWFSYYDDRCNSFLIQIRSEINKSSELFSFPGEIARWPSKASSTPNDLRICSASSKKGREVQSLTLNDFGWWVESRERGGAIESEGKKKPAGHLAALHQPSHSCTGQILLIPLPVCLPFHSAVCLSVFLVSVSFGLIAACLNYIIMD